MKVKNASKNQLRRFPIYLSYLRERQAEGMEFISSPQIAMSLNLSEEQVRKDINLISSKSGKPKIGRDIKLLIYDIEEFLGYRDSRKAILIGAGHLGRALMAHDGFSSYGLDIICAFDNDINKTDCIFNNKHIYSLGHIWVLFLLWFHLFILSGVISPLISSSILGIYQPGEFIFQCLIFLTFCNIHGVLKAIV